MQRFARVALAVVALGDLPAATAEEAPAPQLVIARIDGPIEIDGDLSDPSWAKATRIATWYETNPGDNVEPGVASVGYLAYDDKFLYAAFEFSDPEIKNLRAPFADRDDVSSSTDYGGIILDTQNEGKRAFMFLANPRGIQYDAVTDDASGEDSSPDFFWDSAAKVGADGWVLEIRVPFSSLRYAATGNQTWRFMLYRNYPRDYRYQFFSTRLPRGGNCFICHADPLDGLENLPAGGRLVVAPYVSGMRQALAAGEPGSPLRAEDPEGDVGVDAKWTPREHTALDLTLNPDFSQVESDVAQIGVNERFALFFPEKRPFFLEGIDLFATPIQAAYTRTITAPRWGTRATGRFGSSAYTVLVAEDRGGGSTVLPGPNGSSFADQDSSSFALLGRVRRDLGRSFVSLLATDRELDGGGHNRVVGPDFEWRPNDRNRITGQLLFSDSETPNRPELADEWDGRDLSGHAAVLWWARSTRTSDQFAQFSDLSDGFRADNGFVPQVGFRQGYAEIGRTWRPTGFLRRVRGFLIADRQEQRDGDLIFRRIVPGAGMDARWNTFLRFEAQLDEVRAGDRTFDRNRLRYIVESSPGRVVNRVGIDGTIGEEVDFANVRSGDGGTISAFTTLRPWDHLALTLNGTRRWLDLDEPGAQGRLFTAHVARLRAQYTFSSRMFLRLIGQWVETRRDPALYTFEVPSRSGEFGASVLAAHKLNWQSVMFVGYGDTRVLTEDGSLERADRQLFVKLSYAFQR